MGNLHTVGGSNDIEVFVTDANGLRAFVSHRSCSPLYNTQRVFGPIKLDWKLDDRFLGNGVYHMVLNNRFAVATPKRVTGSVFLEFEIESNLKWPF